MPAWNEEGVIAVVIAELRQVAPMVDVLVIDDGSVDKTVEAAASAGVPVVRLPFNLGVGGAMRTGFLYADRNGYDGVVQLDSDGQHDPALIPVLLDALDEADVVVGSRFAGTHHYQAGGLRRLAMRMLAGVLSRLCRTRLSDVTSGFRAAGPRAVPLFARAYPTEYLGDTVESLVLAKKAGLVVREVPVAMRPRAGGSPSQSPIRAAVYLARAALVLVLALIRPNPDVGSAGRLE